MSERNSSNGCPSPKRNQEKKQVQPNHGERRLVNVLIRSYVALSSQIVLQTHEAKYMVRIAPDELSLVDVEEIAHADVRREALPYVVTNLEIEQKTLLNTYLTVCHREGRIPCWYVVMNLRTAGEEVAVEVDVQFFHRLVIQIEAAVYIGGPNVRLRFNLVTRIQRIIGQI